MRGSTSRSITSTSASWRCWRAFRVRRSGSPGPQPINATRPACCLCPPSISSARMRSASASAPLRTAWRNGPCSNRSHRRRRARGSVSALARRWRSAWARAASTPRWAGSSASMRARISRASTGAAPSVPIATVTGERSTMAGVMKVDSSGASTTLTGMPSAWPPCETRRRARGRRSRRRRAAAPHVGRGRGAAAADGPALGQGVDLVANRLGHHRDAGLRLAQQPQLLRRLLAAAGHEHGGGVEIGEHGEIVHGDLASRATDSEPPTLDRAGGWCRAQGPVLEVHSRVNRKISY